MGTGGAGGRFTGVAVHVCGGAARTARGEVDWSRLGGRGITALAQPTQGIGVTAFECLLNRRRGGQEAARLYDFPAQLIVRGSTRQRA